MHEPPPYHSLHIPASPTYTTHFTDHFAGTSSGATHILLDSLLNEIHARSVMDTERDCMIHAMQQQQIEVIHYMHQMQ